MNVIQLQESAWNRLQGRRAQLPHALLLIGQRGVGKFELAQAFAAGLLCEQPAMDGQACGQCSACNWLSQGNHPDFRLVQPEALSGEEAEADAETGKKKPSQQITIDQVRGLDEFLHVGTHRQGVRVVLLHPAEAMNRNTANALLKSLEEPRPGTLFLLVSSEADRLLPTIRSRCQTVEVPLPSAESATAWLASRKVAEPVRWLALAGGAPRLAAELAGSGQRSLLDALLGQLQKGRNLDPIAAAAAVDKALKADKSGALTMKRTVEWLQKWGGDLALSAVGQPPRYFQADAATISQLAKAMNIIKIIAFNRLLVKFKAQSEHPLNSRLVLEELFFAYRALHQ
ncbi:DNA polymerase III subunit delta' [Azospira sp. I13]|uniref:DNA polymerase III subunit delta' n=1 Tax=Azospira sp. I13 TaxID=1765050 RepID=UPI000D3F2758|nr:DNA polymerase III subunit delta' [Azospira sp. I13]GBG03519.1 DNA polymerase III subunit delta' [Azospira sp. I13]